MAGPSPIANQKSIARQPNEQGSPNRMPPDCHAPCQSSHTSCSPPHVGVSNRWATYGSDPYPGQIHTERQLVILEVRRQRQRLSFAGSLHRYRLNLCQPVADLPPQGWNRSNFRQCPAPDRCDGPRRAQQQPPPSYNNLLERCLRSGEGYLRCQQKKYRS